MSPVKRINSLLLLALLLIGGVAAALVLDRLERHYHGAAQAVLDNHRRELDILAGALAYLVDINEASITQLAREREVVDLLEFADPETIEAWTTRQRRFIPMGFGLGIIDSRGRLIGDNTHQRIGLACLSDARLIFAGATAPRPLIHNDIDGLEHYDVMKPVRDAEGQVIGHLLASFRLDVFHGWLDHVHAGRTQQRIEVIERSGQVLAHRGADPDGADNLTIIAPVPGTQFELRLTVVRPAVPPFVDDLGWIAALAALLALATFLCASLTLQRALERRAAADGGAVEQPANSR